jgi:predicted TIM-barrel fold metal-dependent hydrolase
MAAALPNVWMDLSLGIPFAPVAADRIVSTALELAPIPRILFGSDAFSGPEQSWLGAKLAKAALARVLALIVANDYLTETNAREAAAAILAENARSLYAGR